MLLGLANHCQVLPSLLTMWVFPANNPGQFRCLDTACTYWGLGILLLLQLPQAAERPHTFTIHILCTVMLSSDSQPSLIPASQAPPTQLVTFAAITMLGVRTLFIATMNGLWIEKINEEINNFAGIDSNLYFIL